MLDFADCFPNQLRNSQNNKRLDVRLQARTHAQSLVSTSLLPTSPLSSLSNTLQCASVLSTRSPTPNQTLTHSDSDSCPYSSSSSSSFLLLIVREV